jgi:hypothetical protein
LCRFSDRTSLPGRVTSRAAEQPLAAGSADEPVIARVGERAEEPLDRDDSGL